MSVPLAAEAIAIIGPLTVTNSLINAWIVTAFLLIMAWIIRAGVKRAQPNMAPRGLINFAEFIIEKFLNVFDSVTGNRARSKKFLPIVGTFFIFILLNNWLAQLPGTGSVGIWEKIHGELELIPILRPATSDINLTLALGCLSVFITHIVGISTLGVFRHLNKFIQIGSVIKSFQKGPVGIFTALIEFVVGLIEAVGEAAKAISLSLRLFGNIFAGEVLITVMLSLAAYIVPLPFQALELLVGIIQATVFAMLTLVFLTMATEAPHGEHYKSVAH